MGVVLRPDVFGTVAKPQLCSEHVGTCTCGGYINSKSTSDCVQSIMYTYYCGEHLCKGRESIPICIQMWQSRFEMINEGRYIHFWSCEIMCGNADIHTHSTACTCTVTFQDTTKS